MSALASSLLNSRACRLNWWNLRYWRVCLCVILLLLILKYLVSPGGIFLFCHQVDKLLSLASALNLCMQRVKFCFNSGSLFLFILMKFTCLSEGNGYHFPSCHILDLCGFRILFDCPLDLSSLSIFSPVPIKWSTMVDEDTNACACHTSTNLEFTEKKRQKSEKPLDGSSLIHAEPWYKAVKSLKLWDVSFIDVVLISSPMGMLGLPFLTRGKDFCAKIYATEAATRLGQLMMEDLITMHNEFRQFYGPEGSNRPEWMKWDEIESLPSALKEIVLGQDGRELGGWMPLYSAADLKDCMQKVQSLKLAEEACYNGTLIIKAFSSGLDIGTSNWSIISPKQNVSYLSSSTFASAPALNFDFKALQGSDVILFSDFTVCSYLGRYESENNGSTSLDKYLSNLSNNDENEETVAKFLLNADESSEELEKLDFLCSCSLESVKAGGSVLIPIGRLGIMLQLLEQIAILLDSSDLKVPILVVSSVAEELFAFLNVIPEWLCEQRQDRLYSGQPLFAHVELLKEKRLCLYPVLHSPKLLTNWQEPCIVFCPHWSLRIGPAVHLLRRWCQDENSLLIVEEAADMDFVFLPFKPMAMRVLQCSFLSGMKWQKAETLLKFLKPKHVLFPEKLRQGDSCVDQLFTLSYYSENETLRMPNLKDSLEIDIGIDLACRLRYTKLEQEDVSIARVKGELFREHGETRLFAGSEQVLSSQTRPLLYLGRVNLEILLTTLQKFGMNTRVEEVSSVDGSEKASIVHVLEPNRALIEVTAARTIICTADESFASCISEAISSILDCI